MNRVFLATALSSALLISAAQAAPNKFFDNLSGSWSGSGQAYVTKYGDISANCRVAITGAETKVAMNGSCGMLVFRQALGLSIRNAGGNRYVGTYTGDKSNSKGIYSYRFDSATGQLTPIGLAGETPNPSYIVIHPNRKWLYAANELASYQGKPSGSISAFRIDGPKLAAINVVPGNGAVTCHLSIDKTGKYLVAANYNGGNVGSFPIRADGSLGEAIVMLKHEGSGPHARQKQPHAHSINISANNRWAVAADLGTDRLYVNGFNAATGMLTARPAQEAKLKPGSGPRHFAFHPNQKLAFSINEIASTLTSWRFDAAGGTLTEIQTETTLPSDFKGENTTAEVVVHPNGKWVYGSNRGHHSIAVFTWIRPRDG